MCWDRLIESEQGKLPQVRLQPVAKRPVPSNGLEPETRSQVPATPAEVPVAVEVTS